MKKQKNLIFLVVIFLVIGFAYYAYNSLNVSPAEVSSDNKSDSSLDDKPDAPDFKVYDKDNNEVNLSDFKGEYIVINFWASWCSPCRAEMDHFQEAYDKYSEKGVKFFMINATDGDRETVQTASEYFKENSYDMDIYFDVDFDASINYSVRSLPTTFFIDKDGKVIAYKLGTFEKDLLFDSIDSLIGEK